MASYSAKQSEASAIQRVQLPRLGFVQFGSHIGGATPMYLRPISQRGRRSWSQLVVPTQTFPFTIIRRHDDVADQMAD